MPRAESTGIRLAERHPEREGVRTDGAETMEIRSGVPWVEQNREIRHGPASAGGAGRRRTWSESSRRDIDSGRGQDIIDQGKNNRHGTEAILSTSG